jgi:nicotinamidase-related amidase
MRTALIVIDVQNAIQHAGWGKWNNPDAELNISALLRASTTTKRPIYRILRDSTEPASHYRPGQSGHEFMPKTSLFQAKPLLRSKRTALYGDRCAANAAQRESTDFDRDRSCY